MAHGRFTWTWGIHMDLENIHGAIPVSQNTVHKPDQQPGRGGEQAIDRTIPVPAMACRNVDIISLRDLVHRAMVNLGYPEDEAATLTDIMVDAELHGSSQVACIHVWPVHPLLRSNPPSPPLHATVLWP